MCFCTLPKKNGSAAGEAVLKQTLFTVDICRHRCFLNKYCQRLLGGGGCDAHHAPCPEARVSTGHHICWLNIFLRHRGQHGNCASYGYQGWGSTDSCSRAQFADTRMLPCGIPASKGQISIVLRQQPGTHVGMISCIRFTCRLLQHSWVTTLAQKRTHFMMSGPLRSSCSAFSMSYKRSGAGWCLRETLRKKTGATW